MPMDPLPVWKSKYKNLPASKTIVESAKNRALWVSDRVTGKLQGNGLTGKQQFTFNIGIFQSQLAAIPPSAAPDNNAAKYANAWEAAMLASVNIPIVFPFPTPAGVAVAGTMVIQPPSIAIGKGLIIAQLSTGIPVTKAEDSAFPVAFQAAFAALQILVTGTDGVNPVVYSGPVI